MASQENKPFIVCRWGPKCSRKYFDDFNKRIAEGRPGDQGTGYMGDDIKKIAKEIGIRVTVKESSCFELCPLPWERSNVEDPEGKIHQAYYSDLPKLIEDWKKTLL